MTAMETKFNSEWTLKKTLEGPQKEQMEEILEDKLVANLLNCNLFSFFKNT